MPPDLSEISDSKFVSAYTVSARAMEQDATMAGVDVRSRMSKRVSKKSNLKFVSADILLARAMQQEASTAESTAISNAQIGAECIDVHRCSYSVAVDGTVSCQDCGKGTVKKVSHRGKKHGVPAKSY